MNGEETVQSDDWREARRMRALDLKRKGWRQRDIAQALGVSDSAVSQWIRIARERGCKALRSHQGGGPKQRLSDEQIAQLPGLLAKGPQHYGLGYDTWSCSRVARVIRREFGVSYTPAHVGRILKKLGWDYHMPIKSNYAEEDDLNTE
jgi:transposase